MSAVINTNLASLFAQNSLNNAQGNLATSVQRLSSGLRINSAKDDASGLSIAQTMAGHIKSLDQASLNAQQAVNLAQTADTSLSTVQDILLRMQQLSVEGANGSLSNTQRGAIVTELGNLNTQINSFAAGTTYNGINILGSGANSLGSGTLSTTATTLSTTATSLTTSTASITDTAAAGTYTLTTSGTTSITLGNGFASQTLSVIDLATGTSQTLNFGSLGISLTLNNTGATTADTSTALVTALSTQTVVVAGPSASSLSFQIGASPTASGDSISISEYNVSTASGSYGSLNKVGSTISNTTDTNSLGYLSANALSTDTQWNSAFKTLNQNVTSAINDISSARATLGATMNQLGFINTTVEAQSANEQAARSTVVDTNFSAETANLTKGQIMQQAATAMLAQANQMPNVILSLLK